MKELPPYGDNNKVTLNQFFSHAHMFLEATNQFVYAGINPGGYYRAVWSRDASYILKDWFLGAHFRDVIKELLFIWSHQITPGAEKIVYGRGSPEMEYTYHLAETETEKRFKGALPTTIFRGFSEVYGQNPDIDSTTLMISITSWILENYLKNEQISGQTLRPLDEDLELIISSVVSEPTALIDFIVPRLLKAIDYLISRDIDGDGLLEQGHNEDWMDTLLRAGKIVYSQATWILALSNLSSLMIELGRSNEATRLTALAKKAIHSAETILWQEKEGTYMDMQQQEPEKESSVKVLTQDVSLYVVAITKTFDKVFIKKEFENQTGGNHQLNHSRHDFNVQNEEYLTEENVREQLLQHANSTLDVTRRRIWKDDRWPLVTDSEIKKAGRWSLNSNVYHNHTLWPWTTGIEMLARSRLGRLKECSMMFSVLVSDKCRNNNLTFYEWIDPIAKRGKGAYPFRTGISSIRLALMEILEHEPQKKP
jgi:glycogen debranching enzyme